MASDSLRHATRLLILAVSMVVVVGTVAAQSPLTIYVIDTEGGKAALWIAPSGQTVLIDSGSPGARDLDRSARQWKVRSRRICDGLNASNSPAMVHGLRPRVAIMQNGTTKGAAFDVMQTLRSTPGLEDIWQVHVPAYWIKVTANADGTFTVVNSRNNVSKTYNAR